MEVSGGTDILSHFRGEPPEALRGWMTLRRGAGSLAAGQACMAGAVPLSPSAGDSGSLLPPPR